MQEQIPMENEQQEMVALLNSGNKRELRAFMQVYSKKIFERALSVMHDREKAIAVTHEVLKEVSDLSAQAGLKENINAQLMALTDQACGRMIFSHSAENKQAAPIPPQAVSVQSEAAQEEAPVIVLPAVDPFGGDGQAAAFTQPHSAAPVYEDRSYAPAQEAAYTNLEAVPDLFADEEDATVPEPAPYREEEPSPARQKAAGHAHHKTDTASLLLVIGIIITSLLTVGLVWLLVVKLMVDGILPNYDFGFARWFDANVFRLYY